MLIEKVTCIGNTPKCACRKIYRKANTQNQAAMQAQGDMHAGTEYGTETEKQTQFLFWEYIYGIFVAVYSTEKLCTKKPYGVAQPRWVNTRIEKSKK